MYLLQTIRFDDSDEHTYLAAARGGEWAIPGGFVFADRAEADLQGKERQAFLSGFLGLESFGWSTFATVKEIDDTTLEELAVRLARHFIEHHGAPGIVAARPVAEAELVFAASLAEHPPGTIVRVQRSFDAAGDIRESFATIERQEDVPHARIFAIVAEAEEELRRL